MKNFLSKIFNKNKHKKIKIDLQQKKDVEIFRNKYESYINSIQKTWERGSDLEDLTRPGPKARRIFLDVLGFLRIS